MREVEKHITTDLVDYTSPEVGVLGEEVVYELVVDEETLRKLEELLKELEEEQEEQEKH